MIYSNLDIDYDEHVDRLACPCLPALTWGWGDDKDGDMTYVVRHNAVVARVLRAEGGHP